MDKWCTISRNTYRNLAKLEVQTAIGKYGKEFSVNDRRQSGRKPDQLCFNVEKMLNNSCLCLKKKLTVQDVA